MEPRLRNCSAQCMESKYLKSRRCIVAECSTTFAFSSPNGLFSGVVLLLFCQCGSDRLDVSVWNGSRARLRCLTCSHESWLDGFTVSDFDPAKLLTDAIVDQARKHRKRS